MNDRKRGEILLLLEKAMRIGYETSVIDQKSYDDIRRAYNRIGKTKEEQ